MCCEAKCACFCVFSVSACEYLCVCFCMFVTVKVSLCLFCPLSVFQMLLVQASQGVCVLGHVFVLLWGSAFSVCTMRPSSPSGLLIMLQIYPNKYWAEDTGVRSWLHHFCLHYWFYYGLVIMTGWPPFSLLFSLQTRFQSLGICICISQVKWDLSSCSSDCSSNRGTAKSFWEPGGLHLKKEVIPNWQTTTW